MGYFQTSFFDIDEEEIVKQYTDTMNVQIGASNYDVDKIVQLHRLGYLPLEIRALPEGTLVTMGIPCIEITNTKEDFAWLVQWIECILQVELWKPCCHATIGHMYRNIADYWYNKTTDGLDGAMACADFGMRGMSCMDEAVRCSAAWLLSFNKTSTIPAISYIDKYYNADCKNKGLVLEQYPQSIASWVRISQSTAMKSHSSKGCLLNYIQIHHSVWFQTHMITGIW